MPRQYDLATMSKDLPPSRTAEQFVVRFPDGMRDRIADAARASGRSMNAEIIERLQNSLDPESAPFDMGVIMSQLRGETERRGIGFTLSFTAERANKLQDPEPKPFGPNEVY